MTAHSNGRHFGAGGDERLLEQVHAGCASGTHDEAGGEGAVADGERCEAHEFSSVGTMRWVCMAYTPTQYVERIFFFWRGISHPERQ